MPAPPAKADRRGEPNAAPPAPRKDVNPMNPFEQSQAGANLWSDVWSKMMLAGLGAAGSAAADPAGANPVDTGKDLRDAWLRAMALGIDQYMRTPAFLDVMRAQLEATMEAKRRADEIFTRVRRETQGVARKDLGDAFDSVRHTGTRILDRVEEILDRVADLERKIDALESALAARNGAAPSHGESPQRPAPGRRRGGGTSTEEG